MQVGHAQPHSLLLDDRERLDDPLVPNLPIVRLPPDTDLQLRVIRERNRRLEGSQWRLTWE
jgi:hypothetical protein